MKDGLIGLFRNGLVNELQENARPEKQENQHNRHAPQPPGEGPSKRVFRNVSRPKVKNQGVEEPSIALPILCCPNCTWKNGIADTLKEVRLVWHFIRLRHKLFLETIPPRSFTNSADGRHCQCWGKLLKLLPFISFS
jgi:hypothetical protein